MKTRLVTYPIFGATKSVLPDALQCTVTTPLGELSTGNVHYLRAGINATLLDGDREVAFEYLNGTAWVEPPNARFLTMGGSYSHIEEVPTRQHKLLGFGWLLRQAKVWEAGTLPIDKDGKVQFLSATPGMIMETLITKAKARGWGAGVAIDFTATKDSSNANWANVITISYDLELSLETILNNLYQQGMVDFRWEGRTLRVFNPETTMARQLTATVRLTVADGQTGAPEEWTNEERMTDALILGEDGAKWTFNNGAVSAFGRLERVTTQSGVSDAGTAALLAERDLTAGIAARASYTREFVLTDGALLEPFAHYLPGDWVSAQRGTAFQTLRVVSLSVSTSADGVTGHAVLGDRIDDILAKLAKRTAGITGGATAGGSGGRPAPEGPDTRTPAAPTGLVVSPIAYTTETGLPAGRVQLTWAHDGKATNGTVQAVDRFEVQRRINTVGEPWAFVTSTTDTTIATSGLNIFKADAVTPESYAHRVRAISEDGKPSAWSTQTITTMVTDSTAPPTPYFLPADVTTWLRTVTVRSNGMGTTTGTNQVAMPADFSHFNVYQNTSALAAGRTLVGRIDGVYTVGPLPADVTVWFTLTAVDQSGNESAHSAARSITPTANVNASTILATIDAAVTTISNIGSGSIATGAILESKLADNAVTLAKLKDGEIDLVKLNAAVNDKITKGITDSFNAQTSADQARALVDAAIASGHNLVIDGGFEQGDTYWSTNTRQFTRTSVTTARTGTKVMWLDAGGSNNVWPVSNYTPSSKGRTFYMEAWFKRVGAWAVGRVGFVAQSTTVVGGSSSGLSPLTQGSGVSETVWTKVTATYTIPDTVDAYRTRFAPWAEGGANTSTGYEVDDMLVIDITEATEAKTAAAAADLKAGYAQAAADYALTEAKKLSLIISGDYEDAKGSGEATYLQYRYASTSPHSGSYIGRNPHDVYRTTYWGTFPVIPGQVLEVRYWGRKEGTIDPSAAFLAAFDRYDANKVDLGVDGYPTYSVRPALDLTWREAIGRYVVPADTYFLKMRTTFSATTYAGGGYGHIDDVTLIDASAMAAAEAAQARADAAFDDAFDAMEAAGLAQGSANGKNNVYYLAALPSGTGFADGDTVFIRAAVGQPITAQHRWNKTGETTGNWESQAFGHQIMASVDLGKATVGELDGIYIKGQSIQADKLLVSRGANLFTDPLVRDSAGWNSTTFTATGGRSGGGCITIAQGTTQTGTYYSQDAANSQRRTRLVPGGTYRLAGWVKTSAAAPAGTVQLYLRYNNENSTVGNIASNVSGQIPYNYTPTVAGVWTYVSGMVVVPADATGTTGVLGAFKQTGYTTGTTVWSDFSIQQAMAGELVVDGTLTAGKLSIAGDPSKPDEVSLVANFAKLMKLEVSSLIATTGNLGTAVIDKLWTDVVRSRKITSDMLVVGMGENGIVDPYLQDPATNALKTGGSSTGWVIMDGGAEGMIWRHSFTGAGSPYASMSHEWIPVEPGKRYRFVYSMGGVAVSNTPSLQATVAYQKIDGSTSYLTWPGSPVGTNASGWAEVEQELLVPADVVKIIPRVRANTSGAGIVYVRHAHFARKADASLIVNGGILTKHLTVTEDMTVALLAVHKVKAIEIDTVDLTSDTGFIGTLKTKIITADSVTSVNIHATNGITSKHTITGAKFQTEVAASRGIEFSSAGLKAWTATGVATFDLVAATGALTVYGGTITGATYQTTATAARGIKITTGGVYAYNSAGKATFILDAAEGDAQFDSRVIFGQKVQPSWVIVPWESVTQERAGIWLVQGGSSGIGGDETAGIYMDNSNGTFANVLRLRGMNGAGVIVHGSELTAPQITAPNLLSSAGFFHLQSNASSFMPAMQFTGRLLLNDTPGVTGTANAIISASGVLQKNTSASRFKIDPREMELPDALLAVPVKDWLDRTTMERQQELNNQYRPFTKNDAEEFESIILSRIPGVIAEEVEAAEGGPSFVTYGMDGLIETVAYDRFALARTQVLKRQLDDAIRRIALLEEMAAL